MHFHVQYEMTKYNKFELLLQHSLYYTPSRVRYYSKQATRMAPNNESQTPLL